MTLVRNTIRAAAVAGALVALLGFGEVAQAQTPPARPVATETSQAAPEAHVIHAKKHHPRKHRRHHRRHSVMTHKMLHKAPAKPAKA
jgi:hypothetical protein